MKKDWLAEFIIVSGLIDSVSLRERERYMLNSFFRENKTFKQIGKETNISSDRVRQIVVNAYRKMSINIRELVVKSQQLERIKGEKKLIERDLYYTKLELQKLNGIVIKQEQYKKSHGHPFPDISLEQLGLSTRAVKVLEKMKVKSLYDLFAIDKWDLETQRGAGMKTIREIRELAKRYKIDIN